MTLVEWAVLACTAWTAALWALCMTATSQRRARPSWLERARWSKATEQAKDERESLKAKVRASDLATPLNPDTLAYLEREDVLFKAASSALRIKMLTTSLLSFNAGIALFVVALGIEGRWQALIAYGSLCAPVGITVALNLLATGPETRRWSTDTLTNTARRTYESLLDPFKVTGNQPDKDGTPYHSPHVAAVRNLDDFARALERYAVQRALPDGRTPMPRVVAQYVSAAELVRELRDAVELDREDGRKRALLEVERMLNVLASPRLLDLAPSVEDAESALTQHQAHGAWRGQTLGLVSFTLVLASMTGALAWLSPTLGAVVATASATFLVTPWGRKFGIFGSQNNGGERPS